MNGKILKWAREQGGISTAQLANRLGKDEATVLAWEANEDAPTLRQLEKVAALLKRPLAVFFFSQQPELPTPEKEFRSLPLPEEETEALDTNFALREAHARQLGILELTDGEGPAGDSFLFKTLTVLQPDALRRTLGVPLTTQQSWANPEEAFNEWRARLESVGIIVFKRSFKQMSISGFCLPHETVPVIVVNNGTTWARQVFTLFHETCHLAHHHHGVTRADHGYLAELTHDERKVEATCNRFAADFLVPEREFAPDAVSFDGTENTIVKLARRFNVSREVILRRLLDLGRVSTDTYEEWSSRWNTNYFARKKPKSPGGNYYATTASYLGPTFLRLAFGAYHRGAVDLAGLADHLGVKARNLVKLEPFVRAAR
jgi:Zn-dependent peptidase ImmA (M78 family)/transcriptional regulator with XRE-family HTH domain